MRLTLVDVIGKHVGDEVIVWKEKKTGKPRITNLNKRCVELLQPLIAHRLQGASIDDQLFVLMRNASKVLTNVHLSRLWKE